MNNRAIVTLAIGDTFISRWTRLCCENWRAYAKKHNCDLIVIDKPLDHTPRAALRSPAWQKCLVFDEPIIRQYEQVAWFDCDVLFNPWGGANIFSGVPEGKVGAVNSFEDPSFVENAEVLGRLWKTVRLNPEVPAVGEYKTPEEIYTQYGSPVEPVPEMLNAGVLVASPKHHAAVFRFVYEKYDDRGDPSYYENVPLSYELVKRDMVHWLDPKFNHLWAWSKLLHYPFIQERHPRSIKDKLLRRIAKLSGNNYEHRVAIACATASLLNCYCLHFAGNAQEMELVDLKSAAEGCVRNIGVR